MEFISNYTPVGDIGILVLCLIMIVSLRESFVHSSTNFKIFFGAIISLFFASISNLLFYYVCIQQKELVLILLFRAFYRCFMIATLQIYIVYFYRLLLLERRWLLVMTGTANALFCVLDILEPLIGTMPYDSPFSLGFFLSYIFSVITCFIMMRKHSHALIRQIYKALRITALICVVLIALEYWQKHNSFMTFTFMLPVLLVMFMAHSNPYNLKTGALNMDSFDEFLQKEEDERTYYMCLRFISREDFKISDELGAVLRQFWHGYFKKAVLFNPTAEFVVLAIEGQEAPVITEQKIEELILNVFPSYYRQFEIDYKIVAFRHAEFCNSFQEFYKIFDFFADSMKNNSYKICQEADLDKLSRRHFIIEQLQDIYEKYDLEDERILVYCQPIKNTSLERYDTAEALMRLQLPRLGRIMPNEFIPLVEQYHLIHRFSMIILNKVCKMLLELETYDIKRISVNFSVEELKGRCFLRDFQEVVEKNQVPYEKIGVEFTESTDMNDFEVIKSVIEQLQELGCVIYLDDFGTGYSNFERLLGLKMHVIKFDRSLLLMAAEDIKAKYALKSFSDTFLKMHFQVLYEGIETSEQEALCVENNANYLQGFKYSRPIPIEELKDFLKPKEV